MKVLAKFFSKDTVISFAVDIIFAVLDEVIKNPASRRKYHATLRRLSDEIDSTLEPLA